jgi:isopentenyl diphosphate isomerase/L-lactate dehydrogenase-like FMN-dependent dehydrogenase
MGDEQRFVTVDDYEPVARERLSSDVYDYLAGGAGDEWTLAENRRAFERWVLRPRFLRGRGAVDPSTVVLGQEIAMPILLAPWAFQRIAHPDGELATARAAAAAGTIMAVVGLRVVAAVPVRRPRRLGRCGRPRRRRRVPGALLDRRFPRQRAAPP